MTEELGPDIKIITIKIENDERPEVDLDGVDPFIASKLMRDIVEMLESLNTMPRINNNGNLILSWEEIEHYFDYDEDD